MGTLRYNRNTHPNLALVRMSQLSTGLPVSVHHLQATAAAWLNGRLKMPARSEPTMPCPADFSSPLLLIWSLARSSGRHLSKRPEKKAQKRAAQMSMVLIPGEVL